MTGVGAHTGQHPFLGLGLHALGQGSRRGRRRVQQIVQSVLVQAARPHGGAPAAEGVQRPAEPFVGKGFDQIVHHPQPGQRFHGGCVVCGGDHDHVGLYPGSADGPQKFQTVHLGHVEIQDDQVRRVVPQPVQCPPGLAEGLDHRETAVPLGIAAVQLGDHWIVFYNQNGIHGLPLSYWGSAGLGRKVMMKELPTPWVDSTRISPP